MAIDKGYMSGSSRLLVLKLLNEKSFYGYELIKTLKERSNDVFDMKEGTLYPVLHRMQNEEYINAYEQEAENGKRRKYYRITDKGRRQLVTEREEWRRFTTSVSRVIGGSLYEGV